MRAHRLRTVLAAGATMCVAAFVLAPALAGAQGGSDAVPPPTPAKADPVGSGASCPTPPDNDAFASATFISASSFGVSGDTLCSSLEAGEPDASRRRTVWYRWLAPAAGTVTFTTCNSTTDFDTLIDVFTGGTITGLTTVTSNDDDSTCASPLKSTVTFNVPSAFSVYRIRVGSTNDAQTGNFRLSWSFTSCSTPSNDAFPGPAGGTTETRLSTTGCATSEPGEPGAAPVESVWYSFTTPATENRVYRFTTCDSNTLFDTILQIYTGNAVGALTLVASNDDDLDCGPTVRASSINVTLSPSTTYRIRVTGFDNADGFYNLAWGPLCNGRPANVDVANGETPTALDNVIVGSDAADTIDGLGGNDTICGLGGNDFLVGGTGDDRIDGGTGSGDWASFDAAPGAVSADLTTGAATGHGADTLVGVENLWGSPHGDTLTGDANPNILQGNGGNDTIHGNGGGDQLYGDEQIPTSVGTINDLQGGDGNDYLQGGLGNDDQLNGGNDNDTIYGLAGIDDIIGGDGNDVLIGGDGADGIEGGDGNDYLEAGNGVSPTAGIFERDSLRGGRGDDWFQGGPDADNMDGSFGNDVLLLGAGDDEVDGGPDTDYIRGDGGNDIIDGFSAYDWIEGGTGNDTIYGGDGDDVILGGAGLEFIQGDDGADYLNGGADDDNLAGENGNDWIEGGDANDTITTGDGFGTAYGQNGNDSIEGGPLTDFIDGGLGFDDIFGGAGNDFLTGGDGNNDNVNGENGDDVLFGGTGTGDQCKQNAVDTPGFVAYDASCEVQA